MDHISVGNCGEYFVAAELERHGFTAAISMTNTKDFDILAIHKESQKQIAIQVKTNHLNKKTWTLNNKAETLYKENVYYVFVSLSEDDAVLPTYYIIDSTTVAKSIKENHFAWLNSPGKKGKVHKDNTLRKFGFDLSQDNVLKLNEFDYKNKWENLIKNNG
ncbi:MAG: aspartate ammonia-lyase [Clostridia bacterium]|nr:aspartate ammonia-lyase [Clostridia bacterium]